MTADEEGEKGGGCEEKRAVGEDEERKETGRNGQTGGAVFITISSPGLVRPTPVMIEQKPWARGAGRQHEDRGTHDTGETGEQSDGAGRYGQAACAL